MSPTLKLAKRREGVGGESVDKLHSPKSEGDGGGVGGGVGEALESWYIPHSLFVGSAASAHVAMASVRNHPKKEPLMHLKVWQRCGGGHGQR